MRTRRSQFSSDPMSSSEDRGSHRTVLLHEAVEGLAIQPNDIVVDATLGGAGHAREIGLALGTGTLVGFDLDADAIARARVAFAPLPIRTIFIEANFKDMASELRRRRIKQVSKVLFDLGWSGYQLLSGRGFSFLSDEPLKMTYSKRLRWVTAADIVNEWEESSIADVIYGFGGERYARRIAKAIVDRRTHKPIKTSGDLAEIVRSAVPAGYRTGRIHPATRTFQALRIAVNDELGALEEGLKEAKGVLVPGGRIAVITFHSLEDRIVKNVFAEWEKAGEGKRVNKKPLVPTRDEQVHNPRSRSAKLRVWEKKQNHDEKIDKNQQI